MWEQESLCFDGTIQKQFEQFHLDNPEIYGLILRFTKEVQNRGHRNYSINSIFERIRWHINVETQSKDAFRLNNNYRSRYVRLIEQNNPQLKGFFRTRELKS